jgi:radical SAM superfamily enzyme YgiQ (UPF0313 family)
VTEEMEWIKASLPEVKEIVFEDDTFSIDKKWVSTFCSELIQRKLDVTWSCQVRADLNYELLTKMEKAGCRLVIAGFESGDEQILRNIKKGLTVEYMKKFARAVKKAGLLLQADFIIGLIGETKETIKKTKKLIKEIKPEILQVSVATPFPGTEFYKSLRENGYLTVDDPNEYLDEHGHQKSVISYPWLSSKEIEKYVDEILSEYYLSINYVPIVLRQVFRKACLDEFKRLLRSAKVFITYIYNRKK